MANETTLTIIGNLTADPELKFTPSGAAVIKLRIASTPRFLDKASGEWKDGDPLFLDGTLWRQPAENAAATLTRGMRVIVVGRLKQRSYETKEGEKRTVFELEVDEVGPSLRYATAKVEKAARASGGGSANSDPESFENATSTRPAAGGTQQQAPASAETQRTAQAAAGGGDEPPW